MIEPDDTGWVWLDERSTVDPAELSRMCGLSSEEIDELVGYGTLAEVHAGLFRADVVGPLREALRLRGRFDLDIFTAGLLLGYLQRIERLEQELRRLRAGLPAHHAEREEGPDFWREPHDARP